MTREEWRDAEHFIRLTTEDGRNIDVWHPDSCEQGTTQDGRIRYYDCALSQHLTEWGLDLHFQDVPDGTYLVQYWYLESGWAGPNPMDAEDGIDLTLMKES